MSTHNYSFRVIKSSWGIAIDIGAEILPIKEFDNWDKFSYTKKVVNEL